MSVLDLTATQLLTKLEAGELTAAEATTAYLQQIAARDGEVGAFLHVRHDAARAAAEAIDQRRRRGERLGSLAGLPVAVKDVLCTQGERTTCGSKMLAEFRPPYDATVIKRLQDADAILIGKTNLDEFAMGGSTENSAFQPTRNPWDLNRTPGGSSGGAAAAVTARMAPLSVGTDTGGSIRQPAAYCGVVGLKPTYGRVSRFGLVAFASSLDQAGPLARNVEDTALLLQVLAGHDPQDTTSAPLPVPAYRDTLQQPLSGLRIGLIREQLADGLDAEVRQALDEAVRVYRSLGAQVGEATLPHSRYGVATYYIIAPCEASSNLARYDGAHYGYRTDEARMLAALEKERQALEQAKDERGLDALDTPLVRMYRQSRSEGFGPEVKRRIMLGTYALSAGYYDAYYLKALKVRRLIRQDYDAAFQQFDLLLGPTTPRPAFRLGEKVNDPLAMYLEDLFTVTANLAGLPAMSLPCGFTSSGLPVGLQLQAPAFKEARLLQAGALFQSCTDWHQRLPS